ncbi:MAG: hypothetical protein JXR45_13410 [Deltaproteobacteria bacterium]|nr:hypothetical protein [Deltaproteobacteria bacterium]
MKNVLWILYSVGTMLAGCSNSNGGASADTDTEQQETQDTEGAITSTGVKCAAGYTCYDEQSADVIWVMKNDGNVNGPTCKDVCEGALSQNCEFYACDSGRPVAYPEMSDFQEVAAGLGFSCREGGCWWPEAPSEGLYLVSIEVDATDGSRSCFFPTESTLRCDTHPGNANCFGERYATVCPCVQKLLDEACQWECGPHHTTRAVWKTSGTSCVERINYWRKRACEEGWVECPPAGLPPMVECTACHECANSEAAFDAENGAHASFGRCGEHVQGEGGGATCADVIDAFVSERTMDENGVMRCEGHCGPILSPGCQTFFWGKDNDSNFHTLNWRSCNVDTCETYCSEHPGECFTHETSPSMTCDDPNSGFEAGPILPECS